MSNYSVDNSLITLLEPNPRRGVAQVVAHLVWDQGVAGSSPVSPTISKEKIQSQLNRKKNSEFFASIDIKKPLFDTTVFNRLLDN